MKKHTIEVTTEELELLAECVESASTIAWKYAEGPGELFAKIEGLRDKIEPEISGMAKSELSKELNERLRRLIKGCDKWLEKAIEKAMQEIMS